MQGPNEFLEDGRIKTVFSLCNSRRQAVRGVSRQDRDRGLTDNRTGIQFNRHLMDCAPGLFPAVKDCAAMGIQTPVVGKQRGMDVQDAVFPVPDEFLTQNTHETGKTNDIGVRLDEGFVYFLSNERLSCR